MSLSILESALMGARQDVPMLKKQVSFDAFVQTEQQRGDRVHRCRRYYDGDHDAGLNNNMRKMLNVSSTARRVDHASNEYDPNSAPFNDNYMAMVVDAKVDRLELLGIDGDDPSVSEWASNLLEVNRISELQLQISESASIDGDTYVMLEWDVEQGQARFVHEPAYDGVSGIVVMYESVYAVMPTLAIKIWHITSEGGETADTLRVNVYTATTIRRYISHAGGDLRFYTDSTVDNQAPGIQRNPLGFVPIYHYRNNSARHDQYGRSDLDDAIPLQDALNRTMVSMIMTSELTGFPVRWAKGGWIMPSALEPGTTVNISGGKPVSKDDVFEVGTFEQGVITPFVQQAEWLIQQIMTITRTPHPNGADGNASGESLKQRESGFLGKVKRAQISYGNTWEQLMRGAWEMQKTYGNDAPPDYEMFNPRWSKPDIRSDKEIMENVKLLVEIDPTIPKKELYTILAPVFNWDSAKIEELSQGSDTELTARLARLGQVNGFENFNIPTATGVPATQTTTNNGNGSDEVRA